MILRKSVFVLVHFYACLCVLVAFQIIKKLCDKTKVKNDRRMHEKYIIQYKFSTINTIGLCHLTQIVLATSQPLIQAEREQNGWVVLFFNSVFFLRKIKFLKRFLSNSVGKIKFFSHLLKLKD